MTPTRLEGYADNIEGCPSFCASGKYSGTGTAFRIACAHTCDAGAYCPAGFTGTITPTFGIDAPILVTLLLQDNQFTGSLPSSLGNMTQLKSFIGHNNNFHGHIPDGLGKTVPVT